jgi:hypothetical protein
MVIEGDSWSAIVSVLSPTCCQKTYTGMVSLLLEIEFGRYHAIYLPPPDHLSCNAFWSG